MKRLISNITWFFWFRAYYKRMAEIELKYRQTIISVRFARAWRDELNGLTPPDWKEALDAKAA